MTWVAVAGVVPWLVLIGMLAFGVRRPRELPELPELPGDGPTGPSTDADPGPRVRIVVPARNEARNIGSCLGSLAAQEYPGFRIIVVDDRSTDGTTELAAAVPRDRADAIDVLAGEALPEGWFGKPWACWQGAREASEDLLLFTDADTRHAPDLLARAVEALDEDGARAVSLMGRQELGSFWERLLQPQVFVLLALRYPRPTRPFDEDDAEDAIANGQYILVRRDSYEEIGGHRAVRHEVVEDLRLAQLLTGRGHRLSIRSAEGSFSTRMYESFGEIAEGWTKNLATGARQSAGWWGAAALPAIVGFQLLAWVLPPAILLLAGAAAAAGALGPGTAEPLLVWSGGATGVGLFAWAAVYHDFDVPARYALLYWLGASLVAWIALRSGLRGRKRIEWKGRRYSSGRSDPSS